MALESVSSATDEEQSSNNGLTLKGSLGQRIRKAGIKRLSADALAVVAFLIAAVGGPAWLSVIAAASVILVVLVTTRRKAEISRRTVEPTGARLVARVLALLTVAMAFIGSENKTQWVVVALYALLIVAEPTCAQIVRGAVPTAWNLPGESLKNYAPYPAALIFYANVVCFVLLTVFLAFGIGWVAVVPILLAAAFMAVTAGESVLRLKQRRFAEARITQTLTDYAPEFMVYWDAPKNSAYQLTMWLPYLDRLGMRYIIVTRNLDNFAELEGITSVPVLQRYKHTDIDEVLVSTITTVFYVNNASRNMHMVRYPGVKHVELNHGESDKTPSFSPVMRMYDKVFAAGQAMVDRFAKNGVTVYSPHEQFEIVGRPQVENIDVQARPNPDSVSRVLYAPTWAGFHGDSSYCSLRIGERIVSALIARGCEVIYRPHPHTEKSQELSSLSSRIKTLLADDSVVSGREHAWGEEAESVMSVVDCFNSAEAMIADVSSVVPDFLYSNKPYAICAMQGTLDEFESENPIAAGGYLINSSATNLESVLDELLGGDPKWSQRNAQKKYYLGDIPHEGYANTFLTAATAIIRRGE